MTPFGDVLTTMRPMRLALAFALVALALAGCGGPKPKPPVNAQGSQGAAPAPEGTAGNEGANAGAEVAVDEGDLVALGKKMDKKMRGSRNVRVLAEMSYNDPAVGKLNFKPVIKIQDQRHFEIEFSTPETEGTFSRIRGDGTHRALKLNDEWEPLPGFGAAVPGVDVGKWPRTFPISMFSLYRDGSDAWGPLFEAWTKGEGGYTVEVKKQSFKVSGGLSRQYLVTAKTEVGGRTEVQIVIDQESLRPVTVRSVGTIRDGRKYVVMWTGRWQAGGKFEPGTFEIPAPGLKGSQAP